MAPDPRRGTGITLVELMVVILIVGILAALAVPTYRHYATRSWRTEAKTALLAVRDEQERWYLQNHEYTSDLAALGFTGSCSENCVYTLDFPVVPGAQGFTARARPTAGGGTNGVDQSGDTDCQWFTIDSLGGRASGPDAHCW